jgi:hypothetical protein
MCLGLAGNEAARAMEEQPRLFMSFMFILIFGDIRVSIITMNKQSGITCSSPLLKQIKFYQKSFLLIFPFLSFFHSYIQHIATLFINL